MSNTVVSLTHLFCIHKLVGVGAYGIFLFVAYAVVGVWFLLMLARHFFFTPFVEGQVLEGEWADKLYGAESPGFCAVLKE